MALTAKARVAESKTVSESNSAPADLRAFWGGVPQCLPPARRESRRLHVSPAGLLLLTSLAVFFVSLSHRPLWHTDLWGHLAYGRTIAARGAIPSTEPLMPLCQGVPFVDFSWLSEIIGYAAFRWQGIPALQFLYAASITASAGLLAWCSRRKTGSVWAAALAAAIFIWVDWQQLAIARPQLAGCVCFMVLLTILTRGTPGFAAGLCITGLFATWANLHGSFLVGLALLAAFVCGRAGDLLRRTTSLEAVRRDLRVRRGTILLFLAIAAATLNPYGWQVYAGAWQLSSNANLADLVEWKPLGLWMWQGWAALAVSIALLALYTQTPRRLSLTELLLLVGLGAATLATSRMIVWWGPVAAYYASLHAAAIAKRWRRRRALRWAAQTLRFARRVPVHFAVAIVVVALIGTPLIDASLPRTIRPDRRGSSSSETPVGATEFLCAHPPQGQVFNTLEWGDYLLWAGPPRLEVFVASHVHLVPRPVWEDYVRVISLDGDWQKILERYRINTAIVDDDQHAALADALREDPAWSVAYENAQGLIFVRSRPL